MASRLGSGARDDALRGVSHVFFDAGGTLLAPSPGPAEIFRQALARKGHVVEREVISKALRSPDLIVTLIRPLTASLEPEFFRSVNARLLEHLGLRADDAALDEIHAAFERDVVYHSFPEAIHTLRGLKAAGYRTGVISNFSHRLPLVLKEAGLVPYLDTVTYSSEAGAEKPHPKIFRSALARAGAAPERVLMVGDSYEADYLGARNAGLHALLLCRDPNRRNPCPSIHSLEELPPMLGAGRSRD